MQSSSFSTLPPEIADLIFNELSLRIYDLRSCTLVCKAWTCPSQRVMYRHVTLSAETRSPTWSRPHPAHTFVRELTILGVVTTSRISGVFATHLSAALRNMTRLARITVRSSMTQSLSLQLLGIVGAALQQRSDHPLDALELHFIFIPSFSIVGSLLQDVPARRLIVDDLGKRSSTPVDELPVRMSHLTSLELSPGTMQSAVRLLQWLKNRRTVLPLLEQLRFNLWSAEELRDLCDAIEAEGLPGYIDVLHCHIYACDSAAQLSGAKFALPRKQLRLLQLTTDTPNEAYQHLCDLITSQDRMSSKQKWLRDSRIQTLWHPA